MSYILFSFLNRTLYVLRKKVASECFENKNILRLRNNILDKDVPISLEFCEGRIESICCHKLLCLKSVSREEEDKCFCHKT